MNEVIARVSGSRRLRRFTATYAMFYIVVMLIMNYIGRFPIFGKAPMSYLLLLLNFVIQTPLLFGCVRGIVTREYDFGKGLAAYGEVDKYPFYLTYIAVNMVFEIFYSLVGGLSSAGGITANVGLVLSVVMVVLRFPVKFLLVGIFFGAIFQDSEKPRFSLSEIIKKFTSAVTENPLKMLGAELFVMIVNYLSIYIAAMLAELLPAHWVVPYVLTCFSNIQFGFIIISWPIYYLYCKAAYGITDFDEPRGR